MVVKTVTKYAQKVTSDCNPNKTGYNEWNNPQNAIGEPSSAYASSPITKEKYATHYKTTYTYDKYGKQIAHKTADKWDYKYTRPCTLSAHGFEFDIPDKAVIKEIKYEIRIKSHQNTHVPMPVIQFNAYGGAFKNKTDYNSDGKTGFTNGIYYAKSDKNLSPNVNTETFSISGNNLKILDVDPSHINRDNFGIDLDFRDVKSNNDNEKGTVFVYWIRCSIKYDYPDRIFKIYTNVIDVDASANPSNVVLPKQAVWTPKGSESDPFIVDAGTEFTVTSTLANGSSVPYGDVSIAYDWGERVDITYASAPHKYPNTSVWTGSAHGGTWTANLGGVNDTNREAEYELILKFVTHDVGLHTITATIDSKTYTYYFYVNATMQYDGSSTIQISAIGDYHKKHRGCANVLVTGTSMDNVVTLSVDNNSNYEYVDWVLNENSKNVESITSKSSNSVTVQLTSFDCEYVLSLNYCFYPSDTGTMNFRIRNMDDPNNYESFSRTVLAPYVYQFNFKPHITKINNHRISTDIEADITVIELVSNPIDNVMIESPCTVSMEKWDELDYIGCIPLEQTHFDPKSTYKDTLLDTHYKNKRYMGKKLATDEDITLNVRLHPQQVTTLQGLIAMDKPIPINANHKCFEGDSLNHRGWCEVYGVKTEQTGNNPHWYKCDIDVKYLTHNLNARFKIDKGQKVEDFDIPSLYSETFNSGENLSDMDNDPYFIVDTDGTFYYNDDLDTPSYERNNFNITNGQHFTITSKNPLTFNSSVDFTWSSAWIEEVKENAVSRIVRLINQDNQTVFEYEYDNLQLIDDELVSDVIYRVWNGTELIDNYEDMTFRYNPSDVTTELSPVIEDDDDDIEEIVSIGEAHFGTTLSMIIANGVLSIRDYGFNGREVAIDDIKLGAGTYTYQVEWINNKEDAETGDVDCIVDFRVQDTILTSTYADKFSNLIVSPFPVSDKQIVFTRQAEEGSIYYYKDDGEEFSYLVEPYYQYHNGCDLQSRDGISTVNLLDYGFEVVYILNGLVRLGFNRLNGEIYIGKYDVANESYITVSRLHLDKFDDVNLNSMDDDKIEVQASDSVFTIWRGHPYIMVKHELEDLIIDTEYNTVWAEQVGDGDAVELPAYWDLMNHSNLLPDLKSSDFTVTNEYVDDRIPTNVEFATITSNKTNPSDECPNFTTGYTITATLSTTNPISTYTDDIDIDDNSCSFGELSWTELCDNVPTQLMVSSDRNPMQVSDVGTLYATVMNICNKGVSGQTVYFYEEYEPTILKISANPKIIQSGDTSTLTASLKDVDGSAIPNEVVYFQKDVQSVNWDIELDEPSYDIMQIGDEQTLTATVTDANNNPVEGIHIVFYADDDEE